MTVADFFGAVAFFAAVFLGAASLPAEEVFFAAVFFAGVLEVVFFVFSILRYIVYFLKCSRGRWDLCPDCGCRRFSDSAAMRLTICRWGRSLLALCGRTWGRRKNRQQNLRGGRRQILPVCKIRRCRATLKVFEGGRSL